MAKSDLGKKHLCPKCEKCFYDLKRDPAVCPKCGTKIEPPKRSRTKSGDNYGRHKKRMASISSNIENNKKGTKFDDDSDSSDNKAPEVDNENEQPQQVEGGDEQENVIGDTSDIGGVDDGISEVLEHVDKAVAD